MVASHNSVLLGSHGSPADSPFVQVVWIRGDSTIIAVKMFPEFYSFLFLIAPLYPVYTNNM